MHYELWTVNCFSLHYFIKCALTVLFISTEKASGKIVFIALSVSFLTFSFILGIEYSYTRTREIPDIIPTMTKADIILTISFLNIFLITLSGLSQPISSGTCHTVNKRCYRVHKQYRIHNTFRQSTPKPYCHSNKTASYSEDPPSFNCHGRSDRIRASNSGMANGLVR